MKKLSASMSVIYNAIRHDLAASSYDEKHVEIFNPTEQRRIKEVLQKAISEVKTGSVLPKVFDFGSGTGNLARHLLSMQTLVVAGDVSRKCTEKIIKDLGHSGRLDAVLLNGRDLSNIKNNTFDMAATYSVLHHIPDYLAAVKELVRVVKPGGIIYIDHEVCPSYWQDNPQYMNYLENLGSQFSSQHLMELSSVPYNRATKSLFLNMLSSLKQRITNNYRPNQSDGDIHVFKDDHIDWGAIESLLTCTCDILTCSDYLVCREREDPPPLWNRWCDSITDMRIIIARKISDYACGH